VSVQTRLVLATLCVFNACTLVLVALLGAVFVDGWARFAAAAVPGLAAAGLFVLARRLRDPVEWR